MVENLYYHDNFSDSNVLSDRDYNGSEFLTDLDMDEITAEKYEKIRKRNAVKTLSK